MAEAVVSVLLERVVCFLEREATLLSGVSAQIEDLCTELKHMQCFLKDADAKQHKDERVRNSVREIRRISFEVEDLVDTYAIRAEAKKSSPRRGIKKLFGKPFRIGGKLGTLHKLATEIENVKRKISNITTNLQKYGITIENEVGESSNQQYEQRARQTYEHQVEQYFVGMEDDIEKLVSLVNITDGKQQNIISIWGMGGLGKTTVGRKVYKHEDVQRSFDRFAWTCMTQKPQVDEVLKDLLMQLTSEKEKDIVKSMTGRQLCRELHKVLKETKCLVVLDDIWEMKHWEAMHAAFPSLGGNSKLLLTTRNKKVAEIGFAYELKFLSESEGWELLQQIASSEKTDFKIAPHFEVVGKKLVSKCGGLPLAICLLGGILKDKSSLDSWEMVNKDVSSILNNMEEDEGLTAGSLNQVLSLSYNDLPYHLKPCFLSLGIFCEDDKIHTGEDLYPLWIAEGFIFSKSLRRGETLTDVAERYLNELGHRCMVQLEVSYGFDSCSLHDVMRDFCLEKCREQEFLKVVDDSSYSSSMNNSSSGVQRLVMNIENEVNVAAMVESIDQHTRSLFCVNPSYAHSDKVMIWPRDRVMRNFKRLRVLHFYGFGFGRMFPTELQNLIHLRSLTLIGCQLDELPASIADLPFLHTLMLLLGEVKIPNILWKMKRLRFVQLGWAEHHTNEGEKLRLHGLRELDTIIGLDSEVDEIADLIELVNIRCLGCKVTGIGDFYVLMDYIQGNGQNLRFMALEIRDCDFNASERGYGLLANSFKGGRLRFLNLNAKLVKFPCHEQQFLQGLKTLTFENNQMEEDPMETLGLIPHLERLWLRNDSYVGQHLICRELGFPKLEFLSFFGLPNLEDWRVDEGSMPNLSELQMINCPSLAMLPDGLRFAKHLKILYVGYMSTEFCDRLKVRDGQEGEDYYKIQHVPIVRTSRL